MLTAAKSSHHKYQQHLESERQKQQETTSRKRKAELLEEIDQLKAKKKCTQKCLDELIKSADELAESAEAARDLSQLSKSNAMRKACKGKKEELAALVADLDGKLSDYKSL